MNIPLGYKYASVYAGIRKKEKDDVGLIVSDSPAAAAAVFTQNVIQAAPVRLARRHLRASNGLVSAILVNAGNANCATRTGDLVADLSCKAVAKALHIKSKQVLPASTGVIGVELDPKQLTDAVPRLAAGLSPDRFNDVAECILTTDTRVKVASEDVRFGKGTVRIAGMTKGSGMIQPNMATTLGFVMTDAQVSAKALAGILERATLTSYNSLTVDGDTSTNDMVTLLANGASKIRLNKKDRGILQEAITAVMESLAKQIAADGEGARTLIVVHSLGFKSAEDARQIARAISNSPLVKTAIAGRDPNWGRILAAAGYSGVTFDPTKISIHLQGQLVCQGGLAADYNEAALKTIIDAPEVEMRISLKGPGKGEARFFTCDFTEGYIEINGSYRT